MKNWNLHYSIVGFLRQFASDSTDRVEIAHYQPGSRIQAHLSKKLSPFHKNNAKVRLSSSDSLRCFLMYQPTMTSLTIVKDKEL